MTGLRETTGSESDGGDSSSTKSEGANGTMATAAIQPKKVKGVGFGDIFKDKPIKLRPRSIEVENDFLPVEKVRLTFLSDFIAMRKSLGLLPQRFLVHAFLLFPPLKFLFSAGMVSLLLISYQSLVLVSFPQL